MQWPRALSIFEPQPHYISVRNAICSESLVHQPVLKSGWKTFAIFQNDTGLHFSGCLFLAGYFSTFVTFKVLQFEQASPLVCKILSNCVKKSVTIKIGNKNDVKSVNFALISKFKCSFDTISKLVLETWRVVCDSCSYCGLVHLKNNTPDLSERTFTGTLQLCPTAFPCFSSTPSHSPLFGNFNRVLYLS